MKARGEDPDHGRPFSADHLAKRNPPQWGKIATIKQASHESRD